MLAGSSLGPVTPELTAGSLPTPRQVGWPQASRPGFWGARLCHVMAGGRAGLPADRRRPLTAGLGAGHVGRGLPGPPGQVSSPGHVQRSTPFPSPSCADAAPGAAGSFRLGVGAPSPQDLHPPPRPPLLSSPDPSPAHPSTKACPGPAVSAQEPPRSESLLGLPADLSLPGAVGSLKRSLALGLWLG